MNFPIIWIHNWKGVLPARRILHADFFRVDFSERVPVSGYPKKIKQIRFNLEETHLEGEQINIR